MIQLNNLSLSRDKKLLFEQATLTIKPKNKVGLVGANGSGKSSLFALMLNQLESDEGSLNTPPNLVISHLQQHVPESSMSALDYVLAGDEVYSNLMTQLASAEKSDDHEAVMTCHEQLQNIDGYAKPALAASIIRGLGFKPGQENNCVNDFSGGWRMRLNLARCLMNPADLYLLDEPTNHLDLDAIIWLEKWLKQLSATLIVISHDRDFLDGLTSHILHIEKQRLTLYAGNYSKFEQARALQLAQQQASYEKQQAKIKHMMSFVTRFKAKATKAKQAQSRLKAIEKMEIISAAHIDSPFNFEFFPPPRAANPLVHFENVSLGYNEPVLNAINFTLRDDARIGLLGPNGAGKSTFIKAISGLLPPLSGDISVAKNNLSIAYYAQHQLEQLDDSASPVTHIQRLSPEVREQEIRNFLGGFDFRGDMATANIKPFSGGEKARLALALLVWQKPNLLLLDEPTNHLDLDMRQAIDMALQNYQGAMIVISHDRYLLRSSVDEFYLVADKQVQPFDGCLEDYAQWLNTRAQSDTKAPKQKNYQQKKSLENKVKKLEREVSELSTQLKEIENALSLDETYNDKQKLDTLLSKQQTLKEQIETKEEAWLDALHALDS